MTTNRKPVGGRRRRAFAARVWVRPPGLALLALALFGLSQTGCRSDGCYNCNIGQKLSNGVQALAARVTKHFDGCGGGSDCGCGIGGETIVDSGTPVISGGIVYPAAPTIIPAPGVDQPQTQLEPIQSSTSVQPSGSGTATPSSNRAAPSNTNRSSYTTMAPKANVAQRRGTDVNRAVHSTPVNPNSTDMLDNLPPVELPTEVMKNASVAAKPTTPSASVATNPVNPPSPPAATPTVVAPVPIQDPNTTPPAEKVSAVEGLMNSLPPIQTPAPFQEPGIRRYSSVAPGVSGGSAPTSEGLDWLKEKGVRTLIDLRKPSEVTPDFVDAVNDRNINYISLPILANRLEPSRLARFDDLISQSESRPLFFCDTDGTRAGLCWYLHLRVVGQEDSQSASSKAEEVGLTDVEVKLAEVYLSVNKPRAKASTARVASAASTDGVEPKAPQVSPPAPVAPPSPQPARSALPGEATPASAEPKSIAPISPGGEPTPSMLPGEDRPQASDSGRQNREIAYWRPIAALVMTGLGVPLAYWSRSYFTVSRTIRVRASLPGTVPSPSETPTGSEA